MASSPGHSRSSSLSLFGDDADGFDDALLSVDVENLSSEQRKAAHDTSEPPDIEDLVRDRLRKHPGNRQRAFGKEVFSVTDFVAQEWCEKQLEYQCVVPRVQTEEMKSGTEIHDVLEAEVHEVVQVEVSSSIEVLALHCHNLAVSAIELLEGGRTREVRVWGEMGGAKVSGIIDELELCSQSHLLSLTDTKTRRKNSPPSAAQKRGTSLQLMLYKVLMDQVSDLARVCLADRTGGVRRFIRSLQSCVRTAVFDDDSDRGTETVSTTAGSSSNTGISDANILPEWEMPLPALSSSTVSAGSSSGPTLRELAETAVERLALLPHVDGASLRVEYRWQMEPEKAIAVECVEYDATSLSHTFDRYMEYWRGERSGHGVAENDAWKCYYCRFRLSCTVCPVAEYLVGRTQKTARSQQSTQNANV